MNRRNELASRQGQTGIALLQSGNLHFFIIVCAKRTNSGRMKLKETKTGGGGGGGQDGGKTEGEK